MTRGTVCWGRYCNRGNYGLRRLNNLRNSISQSYATALVTLSMDEDGTIPYKPYHEVTVFHAKTGQPVQVPALSDQGNDVTLFTEDWAQKLGFDNMSQCTPLGVTGVGGSMAKEFCAVEAVMQIAPSLQPVKTVIAFGPTPKNLLGRESILGRYTVTYTSTSIHYQENAENMLSDGRRSQAGWRDRL